MAPYKSKFKTPYHCLGIEPTATTDEIRAAYKALAVQLHPDKCEEPRRDEATAHFQELNAAYEACLSKVGTTAHKHATCEDV